jgi:hypothetical protein
VFHPLCWISRGMCTIHFSSDELHHGFSSCGLMGFVRAYLFRSPIRTYEWKTLKTISRALPLVILTMSPSAARLSLKSKFLRQKQKIQKQGQNQVLRPVAFRLHFAMGLALSPIGNDSARLPQAAASGRHYKGILRQSSFMATSQNGWSKNFGGRITDSFLAQF